MKTMKILNLYACLGGNRYKWDEVAAAAGITIQVTAVENDPELARLYQERFPNDIVIVGDAHQYLLDHYRGFDFIWSSPPCPTHSKMRITNPGVGPRKLKAVYPDMKLYEEIIFLQAFFKGKYIVENVTPYYEPLISAEKRGRHLYWSNFRLPSDLNYRDVDNIARAKQSNLEKFHEIDLSTYRGKQRRDKIARNLVDYEAGKTILQTALNVTPKTTMQDIFTLYDD